MAQSRSLSELLDCVALNATVLDPVVLGVFFVGLRRLLPAGDASIGPPQRATLSALLKKARPLLGELSARTLADAIYALGKLEFDPGDDFYGHWVRPVFICFFIQT